MTSQLTDGSQEMTVIPLEVEVWTFSTRMEICESFSWILSSGDVGLVETKCVAV